MNPADPRRGRQPRTTLPAATSNSTTQVPLLAGRDWALLREIRLRALAEVPEAFGATLCEAQARTEQQWRDRITQRAQFVAVTGQAVGGTVAGAADPDRDSVHLCSMWVDPCARGTGIADQLVQAVISWAADNSRTRIRLEITEGNSRAESLYMRETDSHAQAAPARYHPTIRAQNSR